MLSRFTLARFVLAAAFTAVMAFFALRSSPYLQYIPWMPRWLGVWADHHGVFRNTAGFFVFALAMFFLLGHRPLHAAFLCFFATAIEVAQIWIPHRIFDWKDIMASLAGILLAWPLAWACTLGRRPVL